MEEEKFQSSDNESDEDFCPENELQDAVSEDDSDEAEEVENDEPLSSHSKNKKRTKKYLRKSTAESSPEKEEILESDDESEKKKSDALWASFLSDASSSSSASKKPAIVSDNSSISNKIKETKEKPAATKKQEITKIVEFAGEEIKITKEIDIPSNLDEKKSLNGNNAEASTTKFPRRVLPTATLKRPAVGGSGINSILGQIGKKTKISVLEKSKLDWEGFKKNEGLKEELQTFNKGKDGYLERQDFLQRTDIRQFEIEKNLRQSKRSNR